VSGTQEGGELLPFLGNTDSLISNLFWRSNNFSSRSSSRTEKEKSLSQTKESLGFIKKRITGELERGDSSDEVKRRIGALSKDA